MITLIFPVSLMKFRKIKLLRTNYQNYQQTILIEIEDDSKADVVKELQFLVSYATKECVSICKHLCQTKVESEGRNLATF